MGDVQSDCTFRKASLILYTYTVFYLGNIMPATYHPPDRSSAAALAELPGIWRASQLARALGHVGPCGHPSLEHELPGGGWPRAVLQELLLQQHGIGEIQLLRPILADLSRQQRIALIQPPYVPHVAAASMLGIDAARLLWVRPQSSADALWCAEQALKTNACGAVLIWQNNVRSESLRRLHLAAQASEAWLWMIRPMAAAMEPSPAPLRLALRPAHGGLEVEIVKRRGPAADDTVFIPVTDMPGRRRHHPATAPAGPDHASPVQPLPAFIAAGSAAPVLV